MEDMMVVILGELLHYCRLNDAKNTLDNVLKGCISGLLY